MYVVTIMFHITAEYVEPFRQAMIQQAANSLALEAGCHQFDVCFDPEDSRRCFLYEKYTDRAAFDLHLDSEHFKDFDASVSSWIVSKKVQAWIEQPA